MCKRIAAWPRDGNGADCAQSPRGLSIDLARVSQATVQCPAIGPCGAGQTVRAHAHAARPCHIGLLVLASERYLVDEGRGMEDQSSGIRAAAEKLSRNPLSIIALFIVLAHGFASLVLAAGAKLDGFNQGLLVLFITSFPFVVLGVFCYLVMYHHHKLYSPNEHRTDDSFFGRRVPKELGRTENAVFATPAASGTDTAARTITTAAAPDAAIGERKSDEAYYLTHQAEVLRAETAGARGLYRVRACLETHPEKLLRQEQRVTYRLDETFGSNRAHTTTNATDNFEIWLNIYGEITVFAEIELADGSRLIVSRYLDLPGRPKA